MSRTPLIAVLADVHGNSPALRACLDYAEARGATHYLFLGDYITDHPYPERTLELLREAARRHDCRFIRGNREEYMINHRENPGEWREGSCQGALLHCYERLSPEDLNWFQQLPISGVWQLEGVPPLAYCHGSPETTRAEMRGDPESLEVLGRLQESFLIKGHNHRVWSISHRGKRMACSGSVGAPVYSRSRREGPQAAPYAKTGVMTFLTRPDRAGSCLGGHAPAQCAHRAGPLPCCTQPGGPALSGRVRRAALLASGAGEVLAQGRGGIRRQAVLNKSIE